MVSAYPPCFEAKRKSAVRQAVISVAPDYFCWSPAIQERFRATLSKHNLFRIRQVLLRALFDIETATSKDVEAALDSFNNEQYLLLNSSILLLTGIGDDYFFLNESLAENTSLLDFETIYDYDYSDYCFQEAMHQQDEPDAIAKPYRGTPYYRWTRLQIGGVFYYANLCVLAGYVYNKLDEFGFDQINVLIPHEYVDGEQHGKREGKGTVFDKRVDAGGLEAQLDELKDRYYRYISSRYEVLSNEFDAKAPKRIYRTDTSEEGEPHIAFVFTDKTALQAVRFRHFMQDCQAIPGDSGELGLLIEQERQAALGFLEQSYQDILKTFDPKVVRLRKKRKIILSDNAAKDLL